MLYYPIYNTFFSMATKIQDLLCVVGKGFAMFGTADGSSIFLLEKQQKKITSRDLIQISALNP
jgi:hypothetical protein